MAGKLKYNEFVGLLREAKPDQSEMSDFDLVESSIAEKNELLRTVDFEDYIENKIKLGRQKQFGEEHFIDRTLAGAGKGLSDIYQGAKQLTPFLDETEGYSEDSALFEEISEGDIPSAVGEIGASMLATAPAGMGLGALGKAVMAGKALGRTGKAATAFSGGAIAGGTQAALEHVEEDESRGANVAFGALFGGAGTAGAALLKKVGSKAYNALKGRYKNASDKEISDLAESFDIPMTLGEIADKPRARKLEVLVEDAPGGTGAFRKKGVEKVNVATKKLREKFKKQMDDTVDDAEDFGQDYDVVLEKSAKKYGKKVKARSRELYDDLEALTEGKSLNVGNTQKVLNWAEKQVDEGLVKNSKIESFLKSTKSRLAKKTTGKEAVPDAPSTFRKTGRKDVVTGADILDEIPGKKGTPAIPAKGVSFKDLRMLRSDLGKKINDWSITDKKAAGMAIKIKQSVEKDLDALADSSSPKVREAWTAADDYFKTKVLPVRAKELTKALSKDESDQIFSTFIKAGKGDKARKFFNALDDKGKSAVRLGFIDEAIDKATTAHGNISPAKFSGYFDRFKDPKDVFFSGNNKKHLDGYTKILRKVEQIGSYGSNVPTGQRLIMQGLTSPVTLLKTLAYAPIVKIMLTTPKGIKFMLASDKLELSDPKMTRLIESMYKHFKKNYPKLVGQVQAGSANEESP